MSAAVTALRLRCLRLALHAGPIEDDIVAIARRYEAFVMRGCEGGNRSHVDGDNAADALPSPGNGADVTGDDRETRFACLEIAEQSSDAAGHDVVNEAKRLLAFVSGEEARDA